jgi:hypothetical protein
MPSVTCAPMFRKILLPPLSGLKMKAACSFGILVTTYQTTQRNIPLHTVLTYKNFYGVIRLFLWSAAKINTENCIIQGVHKRMVRF